LTALVPVASRRMTSPDDVILIVNLQQEHVTTATVMAATQKPSASIRNWATLRMVSIRDLPFIRSCPYYWNCYVASLQMNYRNTEQRQATRGEAL